MRILLAAWLIWLMLFTPSVYAAWPHGGPDETPHCTACHSAHGATADHLLRGGTAMCSSCHSFQDPEGLWPGIECYDQSVHKGLCTQCHDPHGVIDNYGKTPHLTLKRGAGLCFDCHQDLAADFREARLREERGEAPSRHHVEGFAAKVTCSDCHNPHLIEPEIQGWEARVTNPGQPNQLVPFKGNMVINRFCITCHDGSRETAPNILSEIKGEKRASNFFSLTGQDSLHRIHLTRTHVQNCLLCHKPHTSKGTEGINRGRLLYGMTIHHFAQGYPGYNSCETSCHGDRCGACHPLPPFETSVDLR